MCKKEDLESHRKYLEEDQIKNIPEEDLKNHNFQIEKKHQ